MASFESTVTDLLKASETLTAVVPAASIYFGEMPATVPAPFIACYRISTVPQNTINQGANPPLDNITLQVSCYGITPKQANKIARLIRGVLTDATAVSALLTGQTQTFEEDINMRGQVLTFSCWYTETFD